jgi:hypothetical protein
VMDHGDSPCAVDVRSMACSQDLPLTATNDRAAPIAGVACRRSIIKAPTMLQFFRLGPSLIFDCPVFVGPSPARDLARKVYLAMPALNGQVPSKSIPRTL